MSVYVNASVWFSQKLWIPGELELWATVNCLKWELGTEIGVLQKQHIPVTHEPLGITTPKGKYQFLSIPGLNSACKQKTWSLCNPVFRQRGHQSTWPLGGWYGWQQTQAHCNSCFNYYRDYTRGSTGFTCIFSIFYTTWRHRIASS